MDSESFPFHVGCPMHLSRRAFLAGASACTAGVASIANVATSAIAAEKKAPRKARVRLVFTHKPSEKPT